MMAVRGRRGRRIASAVAIFLTAIALQRACTLPWGRAAAPDGTTYELTAVGLSRLASPPGVVRSDCRWWPRYGDATLCRAAPDGAVAHARLRFAYPLLQVALWLSVASVFLQALRVPRQRPLQVAVPLAACILSGGAIAVMSRGARTGLAALADAPPALGGAGHTFAIAAVVLSALSAALLTESFSAARDA
jgi:hypothetical protein